MEDPKKKPKYCQKDNCNREVIEGRFCPSCTYNDLMDKKSKKIRKSWGVKVIKPKIIGKTEANSLKFDLKKELTKEIEKCHALWAKYIANDEDSNGYYRCSTCPNAHRRELHGMHSGHLYKKSEYWPMAYLYQNGADQCHSCNVVNEGRPLELRRFLVARHGFEEIGKLDEFAALIKKLINRGFINNRPRPRDIIFFQEYRKRLVLAENMTFDEIINFVLTKPCPDINNFINL